MEKNEFTYRKLLLGHPVYTYVKADTPIFLLLSIYRQSLLKYPDDARPSSPRN